MDIQANLDWSSRMSAQTPSVESLAQIDDTTQYDERRFDVLARFSASLRWQMVSISFVMAAILWFGDCPPAGIAAWLLLTLLVRELRAAAIVRMNRERDRPIAARLREVTWWTFGLALTQGSSALFLLQMDTAFGALLTMVLLGQGTGAVSTTFTVRSAFVAYVAGIALPATLMWLLDGGALSISIAVIMLMLFAVQLRFARQNLDLFEESYRMRLENMTLLRQLSEERSQLAQARDLAVQADLSKSRFLAAASHDLRQPLQSMTLNIGSLSRMQRDAENAEIAEEISASIDALRQMLDALLDVSKLDAGAVKPAIQQVRLDLLIAGLCKRFHPAAESHGIRLHGDCTPGLVVMSDVDMLQRVLSNLIDNAIKFTEKGSIMLTAFPQDDQVRVIVQDTGIGIAEADQARVFEDLVQLDNPQRDRAFGHGLGLGIVRRLTQLLGVDCTMESRPGAGTRFTLRLAQGAAEAPVPTAITPSYPSLVARRVLVLDDDPSVRTAYANALQALGCKVMCTGTLAEALQALPTHEPEVALVDYRLAESHNGLQAIEHLRVERPGLPAVIVTADTSSALRAEAARHGVPMLRKPVTEAMLAVVIDEALITNHQH